MTSVRNRKHLKGFELREYMNHQVLSLVSGFFLSWWDDNSPRIVVWFPLDAIVLWKWTWKMRAQSIRHTHTQERLPPLPKNDTWCVLTCHVPWNLVSRCIFLLKPVPFQGTLIMVRGSIFVVFQASQELSFTFSPFPPMNSLHFKNPSSR